MAIKAARAGSNGKEPLSRHETLTNSFDTTTHRHGIAQLIDLGLGAQTQVRGGIACSLGTIIDNFRGSVSETTRKGDFVDFRCSSIEV